MIKTVLTAGFIAAVGAGAAFMWMKKTTIKGEVMAADLLVQLEDRGITKVDCDDAEVSSTGAVFVCRVAAKDGSRATIEYVMNREGAISGRQVGASDHSESESAERPDPSSDPWAK